MFTRIVYHMLPEMVGKTCKSGQPTLLTNWAIADEEAWQTQFGSFHILILLRRGWIFRSQRVVTLSEMILMRRRGRRGKRDYWLNLLYTIRCGGSVKRYVRPLIGASVTSYSSGYGCTPLSALKPGLLTTKISNGCHTHSQERQGNALIGRNYPRIHRRY